MHTLIKQGAYKWLCSIFLTHPISQHFQSGKSKKLLAVCWVLGDTINAPGPLTDTFDLSHKADPHMITADNSRCFTPFKVKYSHLVCNLPDMYNLDNSRCLVLNV